MTIIVDIQGLVGEVIRAMMRVQVQCSWIQKVAFHIEQNTKWENIVLLIYIVWSQKGAPIQIESSKMIKTVRMVKWGVTKE